MEKTTPITRIDLEEFLNRISKQLDESENTQRTTTQMYDECTTSYAEDVADGQCDIWADFLESSKGFGFLLLDLTTILRAYKKVISYSIHEGLTEFDCDEFLDSRCFKALSIASIAYQSIADAIWQIDNNCNAFLTLPD